MFISHFYGFDVDEGTLWYNEVWKADIVLHRQCAHLLPHCTDQYHDSFLHDSDYHGLKKNTLSLRLRTVWTEGWVSSVNSKQWGSLPTWEQSSITSSTTDVLDFIHTRPAAQRHTAQSGASLAFSLTLTHCCKTPKILSKKHCQWVLLLLTVIVVKFIKSMPQRRQEQTAERKGEQAERRGGEREQQWDSGSQKQDTRKQVGRGKSASHLLTFIITVALRLTLKIIWFKLGLASCLKRVQNPDFIPAWWMSEAAKRHTLTSSHTAAQALILSPQSSWHSNVAVRDSEWGDSTETPVREKGAVYSTCTFNEQFLPMTTQQRPGQKRGKVHKNLPQQGGHLLQSTLQLCGDATVGGEWGENYLR